MGKDCRSFPIAKVVSGVTFYRDEAGSIPEPKLEKAEREALAPVRDFMACLEQAVDKPADAEAVTNAYAALHNWAEADAIIEAPPNVAGRVARVFYSAGFGLIVLKFRYRGLPRDAVVEAWLAKLAAAVRSDYEGFHGNVLPFAGATNALSALVSGDEAGLEFQEKAWRTEIGDIQPDGDLPSETARAGRATIYHELAASGLLLLHDVRKALGIQDDPAALAKLKSLTALIGRSLRDPGEMEQLAGGAAQEVPGPWAYRLPFAFANGLLPPDWFQCAPVQTDFNAVDCGGDTRVAAAAVEAAAGDQPG